MLRKAVKSSFLCKPSKFARSYATSETVPKIFGVVGAGQMGTGIALVAAMNAKMSVKLHDANKQSLEKSIKFADKLLSGYVEKKKITAEEKELIQNRIVTTSELGDFKDADFIVEAIIENEQIKSQLFSNLSQVTPQHTILATNTSSIPISFLAKSTNRPDKVIGMHFMNPVPVMKLVEIIAGDTTSRETYERTVSLAHKMGKETSYCMKDSPGFIANRILMPYLNEAIIALEEGIATPEDIDKTMLLGTNVPMGPLRLADFIGLDTVLAILNVLHNGLKNDKYKPCNLLEKMVSEGKMGKKSGQGFYKY